jgi:hypothetical protein
LTRVDTDPSPRTTKALADLAIYQGFLNGGGGRI